MAACCELARDAREVSARLGLAGAPEEAAVVWTAGGEEGVVVSATSSVAEVSETKSSQLSAGSGRCGGVAVCFGCRSVCGPSPRAGAVSGDAGHFCDRTGRAWCLLSQASIPPLLEDCWAGGSPWRREMGAASACRLLQASV